MRELAVGTTARDGSTIRDHTTAPEKEQGGCTNRRHSSERAGCKNPRRNSRGGCKSGGHTTASNSCRDHRRKRTRKVRRCHCSSAAYHCAGRRICRWNWNWNWSGTAAAERFRGNRIPGFVGCNWERAAAPTRVANCSVAHCPATLVRPADDRRWNPGCSPASGPDRCHGSWSPDSSALDSSNLDSSSVDSSNLDSPNLGCSGPAASSLRRLGDAERNAVPLTLILLTPARKFRGPASEHCCWGQRSLRGGRCFCRSLLRFCQQLRRCHGMHRRCCGSPPDAQTSAEAAWLLIFQHSRPAWWSASGGRRATAWATTCSSHSQKPECCSAPPGASSPGCRD